MTAAEFEKIAATWRPEPAQVSGAVERGTTDKLAALLDVPAPEDGAELPPLWHEVLLRDAVGIERIGADGHPKGGALLPPLADRRRMFGGGTVEVVAPLRVGDRVARMSRVADVRVREGRSGVLLLVTEDHVWSVAGEDRIRERRDIVYRRAADIGPPIATTGGAVPPVTPSTTHVPDERYLFAYSALTYNLHRIHYDAPYVREVEHHPGLVVHGPLLALWCAEHARRRLGAAPPHLTYRLTSTAYVGREITVGSAGRDDGALSIEAWSQGRCCVRMTARDAAPAAD
ncbi:MaoC family dehydratase N-terminal domain-containing protein [Streptomyces sp. NPDC008139]|uniref:FAS1-like dehydratase domain-containing protein n=1 Tax=Streptomyces sp. NPDC008139 TaxID=3364814 RepID=UPI0036F18F9E